MQQASCAARFLAPLEKTRGFRMTPSRSGQTHTHRSRRDGCQDLNWLLTAPVVVHKLRKIPKQGTSEAHKAWKLNRITDL